VIHVTRNTLDCDQSNYSSRIVFSHIPTEFGQTGNTAIRSADPENPTVEPNMKWIGWPFAEIWLFEIFPDGRLVGRSVASRSPVGPQYTVYFLHRSHILLSLRYVRNVAREEKKLIIIQDISQDERRNVWIQAKRTNYNAELVLVFHEACIIEGNALCRLAFFCRGGGNQTRRLCSVVWRGCNWWPGQ